MEEQDATSHASPSSSNNTNKKASPRIERKFYLPSLPSLDISGRQEVERESETDNARDDKNPRLSRAISSLSTPVSPVHLESEGAAATTQVEGEEDTQEGSSEAEEELTDLYKSRRFKGYLTICLASIINYSAASISDDPIGQTAVSASVAQQRYAKAVGLWSAIITGFLVVVHLDRYSPLQRFWKKIFQPKSPWETPFIAFLVLWWLVAALVQTSVKGVAGDGKEQYNLYYSTWVCCWTCLWCAEHKLVDYGYPTFGSFVMSWPYRAPGWIAIFCSCFFTFWWYLDLFANTKQRSDQIPSQLQSFYDPIPRAQYQWLLGLSTVTLLPSAIFTIVEIFRESSSTIKGSGETILEGFCLLCLTMGWIPSVIIATTPGGFASAVGNAYFGTWMTTVLVLEAGLWFIHDWRESVYRAIKEKEQEYRKHQQDVLEASLQLQERQQQRKEMEESENEDEDKGDDDTTEEHENPEHQSPSQSEEQWSILSPLSNALSSLGNIINGSSTDIKTNTDEKVDAVERERQFRKRNPESYFDTLDDLME